MHFCPYCGTKVKADEKYCLNCGQLLPDDMEKRLNEKATLNPYWSVPFLTSILVIIFLLIYYFSLESNTYKAKSFYNTAETHLLEGDYQEAHEYLIKAKNQNKNFDEVDIALEFVNNVFLIEEKLEEAIELKNKAEYKDALTIVNDAENTLNDFHGEASTKAIAYINETRNQIKLIELKEKLDKNPSVQELKNLLWDIKPIKTTEAENITSDIEKQIVEYTFSRASDQLNNKQFNDALLLVEDGLKYVSDSEKLLSLKTTIDKEKTAFEIAEQQRIEQAVNVADEEHAMNEHDAIKLESVKLDFNTQDNLVVKGEVMSVATIPVNSILVDYSLLNKQNEEVANNKVFVFPDKLYPGEGGKFEFTHFDLIKDDDFEVEVNKITWYTD